MSNIGKKLTVDTPEEESAKQKVNDLCEAIAIMYRLEGMFCKVSIEPIEGFQVIGRETGRDYYSYEELLISQWEKTDKTPLFTKKAFARAKAKEIRGLLDEVERLSEPSYYSNNPVYIMGLGYIDYLNNLDVESKNSNDGVTLTPGIKGRPREKESANLAIYLSCSKEDKTKILLSDKKNKIVI